MALTQTEKHLVTGLKLFGLSEEDQESIFLLLQTEEQQRELVDYMMEHLNASEQDILQEVARILRKASLSEYYEEAKGFCEWAEILGKTIAFNAQNVACELMDMYSKTCGIRPTTNDEKLEYSYIAKRLPLRIQTFDTYWEVYSPFVKEEPVCGSLMDDINDIYNDIRKGVLIYEAGNEKEAAWWWRWSFDNHWKYHAVDAIRALNSIEWKR